METQDFKEKEAVLIVDDNPHNLQVLGKLLQENGYQIQFATNGEAALEWMKKELFDIILLDINMPVMNGFEVCKQIRSNEAMNKIPVIFLSADIDRESILKGFELGAQDYITKPFDSRELLSRVRTHLKLKRSLEELERINETLEKKVSERTEELKNANEQLEALNNKLLDLDKAKSEFLNLISHEIRTPLNGIIGPVEILKESASIREIAELIEILDMSVRRLEKFSLNALLITRLKTRQNAIQRESVPVEALINDILIEKDDRLHEKKLHIDLRIESRSAAIDGEKELIRVCMGNILDNAIYYSPEDGVIKITISDEGERLSCEFKDGGPGFKMEDEDKIFELLSVGDDKTDNSLGTGLPVSRLIMEAHSGYLEIGNNDDQGAFVRLKFKS